MNQLTVDGQVRLPLLTDYGRWRRAIFEFPKGMAFQRMDDSLAGYGSAINVSDKTSLSPSMAIRIGKQALVFQQPAADQLDTRWDHGQPQGFTCNYSNSLIARNFCWLAEASTGSRSIPLSAKRNLIVGLTDIKPKGTLRVPLAFQIVRSAKMVRS